MSRGPMGLLHQVTRPRETTISDADRLDYVGTVSCGFHEIESAEIGWNPAISK